MLEWVEFQRRLSGVKMGYFNDNEILDMIKEDVYNCLQLRRDADDIQSEIEDLQDSLEDAKNEYSDNLNSIAVHLEEIEDPDVLNEAHNHISEFLKVVM